MLGECNKLLSFEAANYKKVKKFIDERMQSLANIAADEYQALPKFATVEKKKNFRNGKIKI